MVKILKEQEVNGFLNEVKMNFPNFVAGIITDKHGFPIASKIPKNFHIQENKLALSAITNNRDFIKDTEFIQINRILDKSENIKLLVLLQKSSSYTSQFKNLSEIIKTQNPF